MPMEQDELAQQFEQHVNGIINAITQALQTKLMYGARGYQSQAAQQDAQARAAQQQADANNATAQAVEDLNKIDNGAVSADKDISPDSDSDNPDAPGPDDSGPTLGSGGMNADGAEPGMAFQNYAMFDPNVTVSLPEATVAKIAVISDLPQALPASQYFYGQLAGSAQQFASANGLQPGAVLRQMKQIAAHSGFAQDATFMAALDGLIGYQAGVDAAQIGVRDQMGKSATQMLNDAAGKGGPTQAPAPVQVPAPQPGMAM